MGRRGLECGNTTEGREVENKISQMRQLMRRALGGRGGGGGSMTRMLGGHVIPRDTGVKSSVETNLLVF